ncbi:MAG: hypothetical protein ABIO43_10240, partial [Sphingomicrobium sp.]
VSPSSQLARGAVFDGVDRSVRFVLGGFPDRLGLVLRFGLDDRRLVGGIGLDRIRGLIGRFDDSALRLRWFRRKLNMNKNRAPAVKRTP